MMKERIVLILSKQQFCEISTILMMIHYNEIKLSLNEEI